MKNFIFFYNMFNGKYRKTHVLPSTDDPRSIRDTRSSTPSQFMFGRSLFFIVPTTDPILPIFVAEIKGIHKKRDREQSFRGERTN